MPIRIANDLPAKKVLESENIFVMDEERAYHQDIRPLEVLILNLMPKKSETETQLLRLLSNSPLQLNVGFLKMSSHESQNTSAEYLERFYFKFSDVKDKRYDALIITGAPIETLPFEEVDYWKEITEVFEWSKQHVFSTIHICWGAQAGLYYHYGVEKFDLPQKLTGIYSHEVLQPNHVLFRGFDDIFFAPHSRNTTCYREDILSHSTLDILAESSDAGVLVVGNQNNRQIFIMGHCEYDRLSLRDEYFRDLDKGLRPSIPVNYFPEDNPEAFPKMTWHGAASLLYSNWLNYFVYQDTPYDLNELEIVQTRVMYDNK